MATTTTTTTTTTSTTSHTGSHLHEEGAIITGAAIPLEPLGLEPTTSSLVSSTTSPSPLEIEAESPTPTNDPRNQQQRGRGTADPIIGRAAVCCCATPRGASILLWYYVGWLVLVGGLVFGMPSINLILKDAGKLAGRCVEDVIPCPTQEVGLSILYACCLFGMSLSFLSNAFLIEYLGPKMIGLISGLTVSVGSLLFAVANAHDLPLGLLSFVLLGHGGAGAFLSSLPLANLFQRNTIATCLLCSGFSISSVVFFLIQTIYFTAGISFELLFWIYAIIVAIVTICGFLFIFPAKPHLVGDEATLGSDFHGMVRYIKYGRKYVRPTSFVQLEAAEDHLDYTRRKKFVLLSVLRRAATARFLFTTIFLSASLFIIFIYTGTVEMRLLDMGDTAQSFINIFLCLNQICIAFLPFFGYIASNLPFIILFILATTLLLLWCVVNIIPVLILHVLNFMLFSFVRCLVICVFCSYVRNTWAQTEHTGLVGLGFAISCFLSLSVVFLTMITIKQLDGQFIFLSFVIIIVAALPYAKPVYLFIQLRRRSISSRPVSRDI
ncbi:hypothetical protein Pelo_11652 [Pelomyxa schiedti]|nr:hypothetical protein Pelo_11652 [Pelomyxa schiedti]